MNSDEVFKLNLTKDDPFKRSPLCDACHKNLVPMGASASPLGPYTAYVYCDECSDACRLPYEEIVCFVQSTELRCLSEFNDSEKKHILGTLEAEGKRWSDLMRDVDARTLLDAITEVRDDLKKLAEQRRLSHSSKRKRK